jgi:hypothetical protein
MIKIEAIPTLQDNYVWAIHNGHPRFWLIPVKRADSNLAGKTKHHRQHPDHAPSS